MSSSRRTSTRGYRQFCGLARALDVVGDRWALLIVRELLVRPRRFGALRQGLCGIATNLLTQRLRQLEGDEIVERRIGSPEDGIQYALTPRGASLRPIVEELIRWSGPLMASGPGSDDFRASWLAVAIPAILPRGPAKPVVIGIHLPEADLALETGPSGSVVHLGWSRPCDAAISATPEVILGLASGAMGMRTAVRNGARLSGDRASLALVFSRGSRTSTTNPGS